MPRKSNKDASVVTSATLCNKREKPSISPDDLVEAVNSVRIQSTARSKRQPGSLKGKIKIVDCYEGTLPDNILEMLVRCQDHDPESRRKLLKMVMKLLQLWNIDYADKLEILGLSSENHSLLAEGAREDFPDGEDFINRAGRLLSIHKSLRLLYFDNPEILYTWIKSRNTAFDNSTPLAIMKEGISGLVRVSRYLDHYTRL
jgi:hypothetical protein